MAEQDRQQWWFFLRCTIAVLLILCIVYSIGLQELLNTIKTINPFFGIAVGCCLFLLYLLGALNIWLLLTIQNSLPFAPYLKVYSYSWVASLITPGQAGDASLILLMKKQGVPMHRTGIIYLIDKLITLVFFSWIALYGSWVIVPELRVIFFPMALGLIILILLFVGAITVFPENNKYTKKIRQRLEGVFLELRTIGSGRNRLLLNFFITILKWLVVSLGFFMAFVAFNESIGVSEIAVIPIISTLVGYVPVSVAGIGTVEFTAGYLFAKVGVAQSVVLSAYLLMRSLQYFLALFILVVLTCLDRKRQV